MGRGRVTIARSFIQTGYPRIDIAAAVTIAERTHPLALGVNVTGGHPVIDTIIAPRLKLKTTPRGPVANTRVALSTRGRYARGSGQVAQR